MFCHKKRVCCDITVVETKMILAAPPANDNSGHIESLQGKGQGLELMQLRTLDRI